MMSSTRKIKLLRIVITTTIVVSIGACGQSPEEPTATNVAQAAEAASPTSTKTNTPTPTDIPTATPLPTSTPTPEPTPIGGGGLIAFASDRDGNFQIYLMNTDGTEQTLLTTNHPAAYNPEFSPDGEVLLFLRVDRTSDPPLSEYHVIGIEGTDYGFLASNSIDVTWSPNGDGIALASWSEPENIDIFSIRFGEPAQRLTTNSAKDHYPAWSPDGNTLAFVSHRDGSPQIYLMDGDGSNQRRALDIEMVGLEPAWSPNGTKIAFVSGDNISSNINVIDINSGEVFQVTDSVGYNESPAWSPDGTMLVFWSNRSGSEQIYRIRADGTDLMRLTNNAFNDEAPHWSSISNAN